MTSKLSTDAIVRAATGVDSGVGAGHNARNSRGLAARGRRRPSASRHLSSLVTQGVQHMGRTSKRPRRGLTAGAAFVLILLAACGSNSTTSTSPGRWRSAASAPTMQQSHRGRGARRRSRRMRRCRSPPTRRTRRTSSSIATATSSAGTSTSRKDVCKVLGLACTINNVTFSDIIPSSRHPPRGPAKYQMSFSSYSPTAIARPRASTSSPTTRPARRGSSRSGGADHQPGLRHVRPHGRGRGGDDRGGRRLGLHGHEAGRRHASPATRTTARPPGSRTSPSTASRPRPRRTRRCSPGAPTSAGPTSRSPTTR